MPFAGFKDFQECLNSMAKEGYEPQTAKKICGSLKHKYEGNELLNDSLIKTNKDKKRE